MIQSISQKKLTTSFDNHFYSELQNSDAVFFIIRMSIKSLLFIFQSNGIFAKGNNAMEKTDDNQKYCPAENLLKQLSGKWKPQIFRIAVTEPIRFNSLLRQLEGSNKQAIANALKEMEEQGLIEKNVVKLKPLHIEYSLSERGKLLIPIFRQLEYLA